MAKVKTGPKTKRKGGGIPAKAKAVEGLQAQLEASKAIIVTEYRGLTVAELQDLRRKLRPGVPKTPIASLPKSRVHAASARGSEILRRCLRHEFGRGACFSPQGA